MFTAFAFIKSIPGMIAAAALAAVIIYIGALKVENGHLETSLAKTQAAAALLKQSNTSLELDNRKKQLEFNASVAEQQNINKNDKALAEKAARSRAAAKDLSDKQDQTLSTSPDEFIKQINRDIGCDFQGYGQALTCDSEKTAP